MLNVIKKMMHKDATDPSGEERQLTLYWFNCIKRSIKEQRGEEWKDAEDRLRCKTGPEGISEQELPYVNGLRRLYEGLKAFLDQTEPSFNVTPTEPFMTDDTAIKRAECNLLYLEYIWREQKFQLRQTKKLDSALQRNVGFTLPGFDEKKWMPTLRYLPAPHVLLDPDCNGIREDANWEGYYEDVPIEEFKARNPALTEKQLDKIVTLGRSVLDENSQKDLGRNDDPKKYTVIRIYNIFARNTAAIRRIKEDGTEELPDLSLIDELTLETPKRWFQFVKGLQRPLRDDDWPYELDDNEFPTTILRFNTPVESSYGFTDYEQMKLLDVACDEVMEDIRAGAYWAGHLKFGGTPDASDLLDEEIDKLLNDPDTSFLGNKMVTPDGKMKIQSLLVAGLNPELIEGYKILNEARNDATLLGELLSTHAREFKDVTALAARIYDANSHQKINRRLGGPEGYEASIVADAIKVLEIAHQEVPQMSVLEAPRPTYTLDQETGKVTTTGETILEPIYNVPWQLASQMLVNPDVKLIHLGIDAIVGPELAQYWQTADAFSIQEFKLSTQIKVVPGSTRSVTKEHRAAMMQAFYTEMLFPLYQAMGRWDLAFRFVSHIGQMAGIDAIKDFVPKNNEIAAFMQEQKQMKQLAMTEGLQGAGGGQ
jgi:hypothetical protein